MAKSNAQKARDAAIADLQVKALAVTEIPFRIPGIDQALVVRAYEALVVLAQEIRDSGEKEKGDSWSERPPGPPDPPGGVPPPRRVG